MEKRDGSDIDETTGMSIPKFIYEKIGKAVDTDIESRGLRPFRELMQNCDDARATTMTLRFDKDRLYVHNDGFTIENRFVKAISRIFDSNKANDPDTSGNFGSGFRSTYLFTDAPEMEWWDIEKDLICPTCEEATVTVSSTMSETHEESGQPLLIKCKVCKNRFPMSEFEVVKSDSEDNRLSFRVYQLPLGVDDKLDWVRIDETHTEGYNTFNRETDEMVEGNTRLGVVFRFPWRTENVWVEEAPEWSEYTWSNDEVLDFAKELKDYAPKALIGCRHLKTIRIVMAGCAKKKERWDFVVTRDTTISDLKNSENAYIEGTAMNIYQVSHERSETFFDTNKKGRWRRTPKTGHDWYDFRNLHEKTISEADDTWVYKAYSAIKNASVEAFSNSPEELGFWDFQILLLPSFSEAPKLPIYTPIPLAGESPNRFAIISMLPPTEDRLYIEVGKSPQKNLLKSNIAAASQNYRYGVEEHLKLIRESFDEGTISPEEAERIIVNCLPGDAPNRWFGTGGGLTKIAEVDPGDRYRTNTPLDFIITAMEDVLNIGPAALIGDTLLPLNETIHHWTISDDDNMEQILKIIDAPVLSENWSNYLTETKRDSAGPFFTYAIENILLDKKMGGAMSSKEPLHISKIIDSNWPIAAQKGELKRLSEILLDGLCNSPLFNNEAIEDILPIRCIISEDQQLLPISNFIDTEALPDLVCILPPSQLITTESREETLAIIRTSDFADSIKPSGRKILKLIDQDTKLNPSKHDNLEEHEEVHRAISQLLRTAFSPNYSVKQNLNEEGIRELRYIPCRRHGRIVTLQNNIIETTSRYGSISEDTWNYGDLSAGAGLTMTSLYHREFIFKTKTEALDTLPDCIVDRLRFLELHEEVIANRIEAALSLNVASDGAKMGNLVRTLLFEHELKKVGFEPTQQSLFKEDVLDEWLRNPPMHLGSAEGDEIREVEYDSHEVKKQLIISLLAPYGDKVSSGLGVKKAPSLELVPGSDGEWRKGNEYCLSIDPSIDGLVEGLSAPDEEFISSLRKGILDQLGIHFSLGPSAAYPAIESRRDEDDKDALSRLMLSLLSSEKDWSVCGSDDDEEAWEDLKDLVWIPSNGDELLHPENILYPTEDHVSQLGENYTHFPRKETWEELRQDNQKARAKDLGFRQKAELGQLILAISGEHTSDNDISAAVKELNSRLLNLNGAPEWDNLNWGPHESIPGMDIQITYGTTINTEDGIWVTNDTDAKTNLANLFNEMYVFSIDELLHFKRDTIEGIRKLGILQNGPSWADILKRLIEVESPDIVEGLWELLLTHEPPDWTARSPVSELFDGDSQIQFNLNGEVVVLHETLLITNEPDEHEIVELDGRVRYLVEANSHQEEWFELLGVAQSDDIDSGEFLRNIVGEFMEPDDPRLERCKKLMAECDDGYYIPIWCDEEIQIIDLDETQAINPGSMDVSYRYRQLPILFRSLGDPPSYIEWVSELEHPRLVNFSDISRLEARPVADKYRTQQRLEEAIGQVMEALSSIHPTIFEDPGLVNISCKIGSGGVPTFRIVEWDGQETEFQSGPPSRSECLYDESEDKLTMYVDEDEIHGNARTCAESLVNGLEEAPWYPNLRDEITIDSRFRTHLKNLIRLLIETDTDEWQYLEFEGEFYGGALNREWEPHLQLFESHTRYVMIQKLKGLYGGCQICSLVTPSKEYGDATEESLIHIIRLTGTNYRGQPDSTRPMGRQLWLCPRHRILWGRRLIRFNFMDDAFDNSYTWRGTLDDEVKRIGIQRLKEMRNDWSEGEGMMMQVFDQEETFFGQDIQPIWNQKEMRVTKEHAQKILDEMIGWAKDL